MEIVNNDIFEHNKKMLTDRVQIHPDDLEMLAISINELIDAGVGTIREITFEEDNVYNWSMLLTDDKNQVYYMELSEFGNLVLLKKDGREGEVLKSFECGIEIGDFADNEE